MNSFDGINRVAEKYFSSPKGERSRSLQNELWEKLFEAANLITKSGMNGALSDREDAAISFGGVACTFDVFSETVAEVLGLKKTEKGETAGYSLDGGARFTTYFIGILRLRQKTRFKNDTLEQKWRNNKLTQEDGEVKRVFDTTKYFLSPVELLDPEDEAEAESERIGHDPEDHKKIEAAELLLHLARLSKNILKSKKAHVIFPLIYSLLIINAVREEEAYSYTLEDRGGEILEPMDKDYTRAMLAVGDGAYTLSALSKSGYSPFVHEHGLCDDYGLRDRSIECYVEHFDPDRYRTIGETGDRVKISKATISKQIKNFRSKLSVMYGGGDAA